MIEVLGDLQHAVLTVQIMQPDGPFIAVSAQQRAQAFSRWQEFVWQALYEHWQRISNQRPVAGATQQAQKLNACRIALIIFTILADPNILYSLNSTWSYQSVLTDLVRRLRMSIQESGYSNFWAPLPGSLLWCLSIGAVASARALGSEDMTAAWFRLHVLKVCTAYYFARGDSSRAVVESFGVIEQGLRAASVLSHAQTTGQRVAGVPPV